MSNFLNTRLQQVLQLLMVFALLLPALPAVADSWSWYGPQDSLGGDPRSKKPAYKPAEFQAAIKESGGGAGLKADIQWIFDNQPLVKQPVCKALAAWGYTEEKWLNEVSQAINAAIIAGKFSKGTFQYNEYLVAVTAGHEANNTLYRKWRYNKSNRPPTAQELKDSGYWEVTTLSFPRGDNTYGLVATWRFPCRCVNVSAKPGARFLPPRVAKAPPPPVAIAPPMEPDEPAEPIRVSVEFTGPAAGGYEQHAAYKPIVQAPTLVPQTKVNVNNSNTNTNQGSSATATGGAGGTASANSQAMHGSITFGSTSAVSGSTGLVQVGGGTGGSQAGATNGSGSSASGGTFIF